MVNKTDIFVSAIQTKIQRKKYILNANSTSTGREKKIDRLSKFIYLDKKKKECIFLYRLRINHACSSLSKQILVH